MKFMVIVFLVLSVKYSNASTETIFKKYCTVKESKLQETYRSLRDELFSIAAGVVRLVNINEPMLERTGAEQFSRITKAEYTVGMNLYDNPTDRTYTVGMSLAASLEDFIDALIFDKAPGTAIEFEIDLNNRKHLDGTIVSFKFLEDINCEDYE